MIWQKRDGAVCRQYPPKLKHVHGCYQAAIKAKQTPVVVYDAGEEDIFGKMQH
jgi:hypothetical protein